MDATYEVTTNLDPEALTEVAIEIYRQWLEFALGRRALGGKTLAHPSGRYAASLSWRQTGEAKVAIIADESAAPEAGWIEEGRQGANMKAAMLSGGKVGSDGWRYRDIPIRSDADTPQFDMASLLNNSQGGRLPAKTGRLWAQARPAIDPNAHWVRMTDKPNSSDWKIPDMPAYSPAAILAELLRSNPASMLSG